MDAGYADHLQRRARTGERERARATRRPSRKTSPSRAWSAVALFVAATLTLIGLGALPTLADPARPPATTHGVVVRAADTLWSIAANNAVPGVSTPDMIAAIRSANGLGPGEQLQPGAVVRIPAADEQAAALALR